MNPLSLPAQRHFTSFGLLQKNNSLFVGCATNLLFPRSTHTMYSLYVANYGRSANPLSVPKSNPKRPDCWPYLHCIVLLRITNSQAFVVWYHFVSVHHMWQTSTISPLYHIWAKSSNLLVAWEWQNGNGNGKLHLDWKWPRPPWNFFENSSVLVTPTVPQDIVLGKT